MRSLVASFSLIPALLTPVVLASPAAAATINITNANCSANTTGSPITGAPGDVINISATLTGCRSVRVNKSIVDSQSDVAVSANQAINVLDQITYWNFDSGGGELSSIQITLGSGAGTVTSAIEVVAGSGGPPPKTVWDVTFGDSGGGSTSGHASGFAPAPILQQFGRPAGRTCAESAPDSLDWSGVASGGWGESWSQWMNDGKGGAVCTRTIAYSTSQSKWIVG
jgi:hypothetical protein